MMRARIVLTCLLAVSAWSAALAAPDELARARLLADVSAVQPGGSFTVGVLIEITDGWHIYWQNPGEAGLATTVRFNLPAGFTVGPLQFPSPHDLTPPEGVVAYGYEKTVLLLATVQAPKELPVGAPVKLQARASWLACREVCIPGQADTELKLDVADDVRPANAGLFETWRKRLPVPAGKASGIDVIQIAGGAPGSAPKGFELRLRAAEAMKKVEFFPLTPDALVVEQVKIDRAGGASEAAIRFQVRQLGSEKVSDAALPAVVVVTGENAERRGIRVDFPLQ